MNEHYFRGLDLTFSLPDNWVIHDDGFVDCIAEYHFRLMDRYQKSRPCRADMMEQMKYIALRECYGKVDAFEVGGCKFFHIFYRNMNNELKNLYVLGHEETHILTDVEGNPELKGKLTEIINLQFPFIQRNFNAEEMADIGAGFALLRRGLPLRKVIRVAKSFSGSHDSSIKTAFGSTPEFMFERSCSDRGGR